MKGQCRWGLIVTAFLLFASCGTMTRSRYETVSCLPADLDLSNTRFLLETVHVRDTESSISYVIPVREAVVAVCSRNGLTLTRNNDCPFTLSFWITEKRISRVLEPRYEVTAVLRMLNRNTERPLFHLLYTAESDRSIRSLYRFFTITDQVVDRTVSELQRGQSDAR